MKTIYYIFFSIIITIGFPTACKTEKNKKSKHNKINKKTKKSQNKKTQKNKQNKTKSNKNPLYFNPVSPEPTPESKTSSPELSKLEKNKEDDFSKKKINKIESLSVEKKEEKQLPTPINKTKINKSNIIHQKDNTKNTAVAKKTELLETKTTNKTDTSKIKEIAEKEEDPIHNTTSIISNNTESKNKEISLSEISHKNTEKENSKNQTEKLTETQKYMVGILESIKDKDGDIIITKTQHIKNQENREILLNKISELFNHEQKKNKDFYSDYMAMLMNLHNRIIDYIVDDNENNRNSKHAAIYHEIDLMKNIYGEQTIDEFTKLKKNYSENNSRNQTEQLTETQKYMVAILESIKDKDGDIIITKTQHIKNTENQKKLIDELETLLKNEFKLFNKEYYYSNYTETLKKLINAIKKYNFNATANDKNSQHNFIYNLITAMGYKIKTQGLTKFKTIEYKKLSL